MTSPSSAQHVAEVPELLMLMLSALSPAALLQAQRVPRYWRNLITSTARLQQHLHLVSTRSEDAVATSPSYSPALRAAFPVFFDPAIGSDGPNDPFESGEDGLSHVYTEHWLSMPWTMSESTISAFTRADATWRKMLVRQPPPKKLIVHERELRKEASETWFKSIDFDDDKTCTMGLVYDIIERFLFDGPEIRCFRTNWNVIKREPHETEEAARATARSRPAGHANLREVEEEMRNLPTHRADNCVEIYLSRTVQSRPPSVEADHAKFKSEAWSEPRYGAWQGIIMSHSPLDCCYRSVQGDD